MITFISLFAGIGGFDLGFERAGMECTSQIEIDGRCREVLAYHWPGVSKEIANVKHFGGAIYRETVDLICGGFPCQDVSVAGRREGLDGERSGLWFEFIRIIEELRPKWVVVENVPGLLSSNGKRDFAAVLSGLGQRGYWWAYRILDAQYFGVPQRRRRVFIVGCLARGYAQEVLFERESSPWDSPPSREARKESTRDIAAGLRNAGRDNEQGLTVEAFDIRNLRGQGGVSGTLQAKKTGGYSLNYQNPVITFPGMAQAGAGWAPPSMPIDEDRSGPLDTKRAQCVAYQCHGSNVGPMGTLRKGDGSVQSGVPFIARPLAHSQTMNHYDESQQTYLVFDTTQITSKENRSNPQAGDPCHPLAAGVHAPAIAFAWQQGVSPNDRSYPVRAGDYAGSLSSTRHDAVFNHQVGVRRLTPLECERLQGFPDGWTAVNGMSDSARYRMLGNAVCVPVAGWIGKRIVRTEELT